MTRTLRADQLLVMRGIFKSRASAQAAITAGLVVANGATVKKPAEMISVTAEITSHPAHPYVSRGGVKLAFALDHFKVDPKDRACLDVGSSTGGFTEVLLKRGAAHVTAVDSGTGQMHKNLRGHPRLTLFESRDIRKLDAGELIHPIDLAVIDVSFISLALVLPAVAGLLAPMSDILALIKPQFEVGKAHIGKGGIVRDSTVQGEAVQRMRDSLETLGFKPSETVLSPISGGDGNREFLVHGVRR